jgi:hypothetical protein
VKERGIDSKNARAPAKEFVVTLEAPSLYRSYEYPGWD